VASGSQPATGQLIRIINYGSGVVTVARSGQNINGGTASLTLAAGSATAPTSAVVVSDGTNYFASVAGGSGSSSGTAATLDYATHGTGADTSEDTLKLVTYSGGAIASGQGVDVNAYGTCAGGGTAIALYFGNSTTPNASYQLFTKVCPAGTWAISCRFGMASSTTVQGGCNYTDSGNDGYALPTTAASLTVSLASAMSVLLTGTNDVATADHVTVQGITITPRGF
jgi:hypothetical protein